jgi:hypothetical protein
MNRAILTTMVLVLLFLAVNSVYLYKLTTELQKANVRIQELQDSVEHARSAVNVLRDALRGELREPAEDLARQAKRKLKDIDFEKLLERVAPKTPKTQDVHRAPGGVATNSATRSEDGI